MAVVRVRGGGDHRVGALHGARQRGDALLRRVRPVQPRDYLHQLPFFVVAAAAAGVCGVVFNQLSHVLAAHVRPRNAAIRSRLVECAVVSVTTVALRFFAAQRFGSCVDASPAWEADDFGVRFLCPPGKVNDVATAFFSSPNKAIGWMLSMGNTLGA